MVNKACYLVLSFIALVAIGGLVWTFGDSVSGQYTASGGGRYISGPQIIQLSPQDACELAGCAPKVPASIMRNEYGVYLAECICAEGSMAVPLVQVVKV